MGAHERLRKPLRGRRAGRLIVIRDVAGDHVGATVTTEKMLMRQETEPSDVTDVSIEPPTSRQAVFDASAALGDKHCPQPFVDASCDEGVFSDSLGAEDSEGQLSVSPISGAFASRG